MLDESAADLKIAAMAFDTHLGMFITDARGRVLRSNATFSAITGFSAEEVQGQNPSMWASGRHGDAFYRDMWRTIERQGSWQGEVWNRRKSGEVYPQWLTISAIRDDDGRITHYVATLTDLSETKAAESTIRRLAFYDPLTGLPNRSLLIDRLGEVVKHTRRRDHYATLLLLGLDNFKAYNGTLGHDQGDALLRRLAETMRASLRESDTLARWGGDQFALLVQDQGHDLAHAARGAERLAEKLLAQVSRATATDEDRLPLTASIGITLFHDHQLDAPAAIQQAELAMYEAKRAGYSSLSYLKRLPLHQLKIDQSFVRDLLESTADAAIVETIIALADRLGLEVTAEGVEREAEASWLREHGCLHFQGFLYARPVPVGELFPPAKSGLQSNT